ncbi:murein biosynthesis integral membrane protein MurJ [Radiobacillus kanasensis]|uniref:murein biosynthesis integral membrane protein MurJ n=1 Tax=Radiobacillus kanasensis TaxID=2844358 RepID=UPI001E43D448|nr:murein biosynthesis integral membrane protein MurJ [Radiobacillus kanasensis]UFT98848.1 murein biosynthesis integral membrane protein MurJ [Radiobacillus kanasensis]
MKKGFSLIAILFILVSLLSRFSGFIREQVIAAKFGTSIYADMFYLSNALPILVTTVIGGAIGMSFVPIVTPIIMRNDYKSAWKVLNYSAISSSLFYLVICTIIYLKLDVLIELLAPGFNLEQIKQVKQIIVILLPSMMFLGSYHIYASWLSVHRHFNITVLAPLWLNITVVVSMLSWGSSSSVIILAWSTLLGTFLQFISVFLYSFRKQFNPSIQFDSEVSVLKELYLLSIPIMIIYLFNNIYLFTDKYFASSLEEGSIAALNYALKIIQLPVGVFVMAVATIAFPSLSRTIAINDDEELSNILNSGLTLMSFFVLPCIILFGIYNKEIIQLAFERGTFGKKATLMTSEALFYYTLGLFGISGSTILMRVFFALKKMRLTLIVSFFTATLNIVLAIILSEFFQYKGLALANSIAMNLNFLILLLSMRRTLPNIKFNVFSVDIKKLTICSLFYFCVLLLLDETFNTSVNWFIFKILLVTIIFYLIPTYLVKVSEIEALISNVLKKMKRLG